MNISQHSVWSCAKTTVSFVALFMAYAVWADNGYEGWVTLTNSDGAVSAQYSFDTVGMWNDGSAPSSGKKYYVPAGLTMKSGGKESKTFAGDVLAVAGTLQVGNSGNKVLTFPELRLLPGAIYKHNSNNRIAGKVVVQGTEENPARINSLFYPDINVRFVYTCTVESDKGSALCLGHASLIDASYDRIYATIVQFDKDNSLKDFKGKLIVGEETHVDIQTERNIPGGIAVKSTGILSATEMNSGNAVIGDLELADNSELVYTFHNCQTVVWNITNSLKIAGSPSIRFVSFDVNANNSKGITIMRLSGPAAENASADLSLVKCKTPLRSYEIPRNVRLEIVDNGDGTKDVKCVYDEIITMRTHNHAYDMLISPGSAFSEENKSFWSNGKVPEADFDGDVYCAWFRLMIAYWNIPLSYPNMKIYSEGSLHFHVPKVELKHLYIDGRNTNSLATYSGPYSTEIDTPITVKEGRVAFVGRSGRGFIFKKEIDGDADIICKPNGNEGQPFHIEFFAQNTGFSGAMLIDSPKENYDEANSVDRCIRVTINDGSNIGGVYNREDYWKAFSVANHSYVTFAKDVTLNEPTRGLFIDGAARFDVPSGKTVMINSPVTFGGELKKQGGGALVLGSNSLGFEVEDEVLQSPLDGENVLKVMDGSLRVSATNAINGLAVHFAEGTEFVVDASAADTTLVEYGAVTTKLDTPFTSLLEDGSINVGFIYDELPIQPFSVAICTVTSEAAAMLKLNVPISLEKRKCEVVRRVNDDGSVTFVANVATKTGMVISVR